MKLIDYKDFEALAPLFRRRIGKHLAQSIIQKLSIEKVNQVYANSAGLRGAEFTSGLLKDLGIKYMVGNADRLNHLPGGAFITVANHPYGGIDGIILIDLFASVRPDYKLMVNKILAQVKTLNDNFILVTPAGNKKKGVSSASLHGIRETMLSLNNNHPVGFFPSGAVSDFSIRELRIRDRKWQTGILRLIHSAKVPVVPVRFFDTNSPFFYFLGVINWRIRLLRLPSELFNKNEQNPRIAIGKVISVEEQRQFADIESFGGFIRQAVYGMPLPELFIPRDRLNANLISKV